MNRQIDEQMKTQLDEQTDKWMNRSTDVGAPDGSIER